MFTKLPFSWFLSPLFGSFHGNFRGNNFLHAIGAIYLCIFLGHFPERVVYFLEAAILDVMLLHAAVYFWDIFQRVLYIFLMPLFML